MEADDSPARRARKTRRAGDAEEEEEQGRMKRGRGLRNRFVLRDEHDEVMDGA